MRVAIISPCFPPYFGWDASGIRDYELARGLKEKGHDVEVIALTNEEATETVQDGILVHRAAIRTDLTNLQLVPKTTPNALTLLSSRTGVWKKFLQVYKEKPFDCVDAPHALWEGLVPGIFGLAPMVVRLQSKPSTYDRVSLGQRSAFEIDDNLVRGFSKLSLALADAVYAAEKQTAQKLGIESFDLIPEVLDLTRFVENGEAALPDSYDNTVVIRSRVQDAHSHSFICQVMAKTALEYPDIRFIVMAEDVTSDDDEWHAQEMIKDAVKEPGKVVLTRGYHQLLPELLRSAPICFVAPGCESGPYSWIEAMACGRAVVAIAEPGSELYLRDGENALLVTSENADLSAQAIIRLRKDRDLLASIASRAKIFAEHNFERGQQVDMLLAVYERARRTFDSPQKTALRAEAIERMLTDVETVLSSYDKMLYDLLFAESHLFKMRHWLHKLSSQSNGSSGSTIALKLKKLFGQKQLR